MSEVKINQIYLSLIRAFRYYQRDSSLDESFTFLADDQKYHEIVVREPKCLGNENKFLPRVGKLRSVLDVESVLADSFFGCFQDYYSKLLSRSMPDIQKGIILTQHYPCAVDILPSKTMKYKVDISTLPGSLGNVKKTKMSFSLRIYPAGLASLRLGWFLETEKSFRIEDIIEFLVRKRAKIEINDLKLSVGELTEEYARRVIDGLVKSEKPSLFWDYTYSTVDIVEATGLSLQQNYSDIFLPLVSLSMQPEEREYTINNLSKRGDVLLPGPKSTVTYLPSADEADRRKLRRWLRNVIELFSIQRSLVSEIQTMEISKTFEQLRKEYWLKTLEKGLLPPTIKYLFSLWNYTNLHFQTYPLRKEAWRVRYNEMLRILDPDDSIRKSNDKVKAQLEDTVKQASDSSKKVGGWLRSLLEILGKKFLPA